MNILTFNCGSSSLSYKIFQAAGANELEVICSGKAHRVGTVGISGSFIEHHLEGQTYETARRLDNHREAATWILAFIQSHHLQVDLVGHRIVHGGPLFKQSTLLDDEKLQLLEQCLPFSPVHNPNAFSIIQASREAWPETPQYATFDTTFHATIPDYAYTYALPWQVAETHRLRKYGFHGLSYHDVIHKAALFLDKPLAELRIVACHLGTGGSSVAAIKGGRSLDTSMGYAPLPGLIMSTRCGDLDPAVLLYLIEQADYTGVKLNHMLNYQSGLLGISGLSSDIRDLIQAGESKNDSRAKLAFDMYVYRLKQYIGSMSATLGGLDVLIFTDDVGLRCPEVRAAACKGMEWCGITLDPTANQQAGSDAITPINQVGAPIAVLVVPNDEERIVCLEGLKLIRQ